MYFFTADQHLYHKNVIKYYNRPFNNVEEIGLKTITIINPKIVSNINKFTKIK